MRRKPYPLNLLARADRILGAWKHIGLSVVIGTVNHRGFTSEIAEIQTIELKIREAESDLVLLRHQRDSAYVSLWVDIKRIYNGVMSMFGDDSIEYELVGRTRVSKRKRRAA